MSTKNSKLEETIGLIDIKNKHQPAQFWIQESLTERALAFIFYILIWISVLLSINNNKNNKLSKIIGFVTGIIILILYDFISNSVISLGLDQSTKEYTLMNFGKQYVVLDDKNNLDFKGSNGLIISKKTYDKMVKEKKINTVSLQEFRDDQYEKTLGSKNQEYPLWGYDYGNLLLLSGSYLFITIITSCILSSHHDKKIFMSQIPFTVASGIFSVASMSIWLNSRDYTTQNVFLRIKSKLFILAFSFAITTIITPFFFS
jgi:hypothetical protein